MTDQPQPTGATVVEQPDGWDRGFDAGYLTGLNLAIRACEDRAKTHQARGTRLALDQQAEADACAFSIRKAAEKRARRGGGNG